jgi:hypothetical protein
MWRASRKRLAGVVVVAQDDLHFSGHVGHVCGASRVIHLMLFRAQRVSAPLQLAFLTSILSQVIWTRGTRNHFLTTRSDSETNQT